MLLAFFVFACLDLLGIGHALNAGPFESKRREEAQARGLKSLGRRFTIEDVNNSSKAGILPVVWSDDKQSYYSVIQAGNISFRVALDTGSADLWLTSSDCTSNSCKSLPKYPLTYESPSFVAVNDNSTGFGVSFADGTAASGYVAREKVEVSNLTILNQAFGMVTTSNLTFGSQISGTLGLGFPRLSTIYGTVANATPYFTSLAQQGLVDYPMFGLSITRNESGSLALGAIDSSVVKDVMNIEWNEVYPFSPFNSERNTSSYLQWAIPMSQILVNGTSFTPEPTYSFANDNQSLALLDVGTPGIYGPYQDVSRIYSALGEARLVDESGQWALPCDSMETIGFSFGGQNFTLQPTDYFIGPASGNQDYCLTWPRASSPSSDGIDWQLGTPFLRTVYTVFSYGIDTKEPPMIGLYPLNNASAPVQSSAYVSSFLSSASATIATTFPNYLLPDPTYSTPAYMFNTSVPVHLGDIVSSELATSTYSPIFATQTAVSNYSAIPTVSPSPTLATLIITQSGAVYTWTSSAEDPSYTLGIPYGWTAGASAIRVPTLAALAPCLISLFFLLVVVDRHIL